MLSAKNPAEKDHFPGIGYRLVQPEGAESSVQRDENARTESIAKHKDGTTVGILRGQGVHQIADGLSSQEGFLMNSTGRLQGTRQDHSDHVPSVPVS